MFQFGGFASIAGYLVFNQVGCPIQTFADHWLFAPPHNFSQLITSFFASESLGILHAPLLTFFLHVVIVLFSSSFCVVSMSMNVLTLFGHCEKQAAFAACFPCVESHRGSPAQI